jgi:arylsulfatase A-like enzyme
MEMSAMSSKQPNILFILADDLGYADVSCYRRRDFTTPNIDRIAAEGGASRRPTPIPRSAPPRAWR